MQYILCTCYKYTKRDECTLLKTRNWMYGDLKAYILYYSIVYQINDLIISTLTFIENVAPQSVRTRLKKVTISAMQLNVAPT